MTTNKEYRLLNVIFGLNEILVVCDDRISMFSYKNGNQLKFNWEKEVEEVGPVIFSLDGKLLLCGGKKVGVINIFNSKSGGLVGEINVLHKGEDEFVRTTSIAFSENGELIAVGNSNGGIGIYKTNSCSWEIVE